MQQSDLVIEIVGVSGEGAIAAGDTLAMASARCGLNVTTSKVYPAEIRGSGSTMFRLRISSEKLYTAGDKADLFFALSADALDIFSPHIQKGCILFCERTEESDAIISALPEGVLVIDVPFNALAKEIKSPKSKNILALGVFTGLISQVDYESQLIIDIKNKFSTKGEEILEANLLALKKGMEYAQNNIKNVDLSVIKLVPSAGKLVMTGNEAIAFGALVAGCKFYAGYPITPATDIMEWIAAEMPILGGCVLQAEDEIAAVIMTIGASFAGLRSMTATSGPGLSLMSEAIGLSSMAEIPLVIIDVQRGGPSTGLPTKPEQSDLAQAVYGTHGDTPKIVIAPVSVEDCFYQTIVAFNLAEKYQVPVILLSDASLGQRRDSVNPINLKKIEKLERDFYHQIDKTVPYLRYGITPTGVSPMSCPGMPGGAYVATGLEHNEVSAPSYSPEVHTAMTEKRFRKLHYAKYDFKKPEVYGIKGSKVGIITWGSSMLPVIEGLALAEKEGYEAQMIAPKVLYPMPDEWINDFIEDKDIIIFPERNFSGQLANLIIPKFTKDKPVRIIKMNKYSGEDFSPAEIYEKIKECYEED